MPPKDQLLFVRCPVTDCHWHNCMGARLDIPSTIEVAVAVLGGSMVEHLAIYHLDVLTALHQQHAYPGTTPITGFRMN